VGIIWFGGAEDDLVILRSVGEACLLAGFPLSLTPSNPSGRTFRWPWRLMASALPGGTVIGIVTLMEKVIFTSNVSELIVTSDGAIAFAGRCGESKPCIAAVTVSVVWLRKGTT